MVVIFFLVMMPLLINCFLEHGQSTSKCIRTSCKIGLGMCCALTCIVKTYTNLPKIQSLFNNIIQMSCMLYVQIYTVIYIMSGVFYKMLFVGYFYEQEQSLNIICTRYCMWSYLGNYIITRKYYYTDIQLFGSTL